MVSAHCKIHPYPQQFIHAFHMPAFFLISGYLYRPHSFTRTLKGFGVPLVFYAGLNFLYFSVPKLARGTFSFQSVLGDGTLFDMSSSFFHLYVGGWFVFVLMICRFLLGDIPKFNIIRNNAKVFFLVFLVLTLVAGYYHVNTDQTKLWLVFPSMTFLLFGSMMKNNTDQIMLRKGNPFFIALFFILFLICSFILVYWNGMTNYLYFEHGRSFIFYFIIACALSGLLFYVCSCFKGYLIVETFSKGTLFILGIHIIVRNTMAIALIEPLKSEHVFPWLVAFTTLLISYYPIRFLEKHCPILLGK